jgi:hypothetical protein
MASTSGSSPGTSKFNGADDEVLIEEDSGPAIPEPPNHHEEGHSTDPPDEPSPTFQPAWDPYTPPPIPEKGPLPSSYSTPSPTPMPTHQDQNSSPSGLVGLLNDHPLFYSFIFMVLSLFCCMRCKGCRRADQRRDARGEYRAVGRMLASNFDAEVSDDEMMNADYLSSDEDDDDSAYNDGWHNHKKGAIEMRNIGHDADLSLDELNG